MSPLIFDSHGVSINQSAKKWFSRGVGLVVGTSVVFGFILGSNFSNIRKAENILESATVLLSKCPMLTNTTSSSSSISGTLFNSEHIKMLKSEGPYKIFTPWDKSLGFPCEGLLLIKVPKCASSTSAGVNLRIANRYPQQNFDLVGGANNNGGQQKCRESSAHGYARRFSGRDKSKSFLWSIVRDATTRVTSEFFHMEVGRKRVTPKDTIFLDYVTNVHKSNYITNYLSVRHVKNGTVSVAERVQSILDEYNFVGLVERLDESLVLVQMLLGLDTSYILHFSSKKHGGFDGGASPSGCAYITPSFVSTAMKAYFSSDEWKERNKLDKALWNAVNRSLDLTIDNIGQGAFMVQSARYQKYMKVVEKKCGSQVIYPCSDGGMKNDNATGSCYRNDWGCGYRCIDNLTFT